ncbi:MAG: tetratricopeptide repeat protein, partial [Alteraurantiacibacter sp. bin_em_oilr2.035]|nr:tetratricopeptide repeat protein [Alteraurantiacibacter sp. bin_em_oilr2.035]
MDLFKIFNPKSKSKRKSIKHRTPEDESITIIPESIIDSSVRRGDEARDRGEWEAAAAEYSAALLEDNSLSHVWVQLGHTVKEQGALRSASEAYKKALALQPNDFDTHVHIAHVFKRLGRVDSAVKHFLRALYFGLRSKSEEDEL